MNYMETELGIWEIAVLALLREAPMHPYQMQRLLRARHKDEILALKRGSLYHAIGRLQRAGFITAESTERNGRRPERTVYAIAAAGLDALLCVLRRIVGTPKRESSEFMAAMSFLVHISADEAIQQLRARAQILEQQIGAHSAGLKAASAFVPRIHLVESEYLVAMLRAELTWVNALTEDIQSGKLSWDTQAILESVRAEREAAAAPEERR
jgi:DNA-binding PadR family transcriptional regulator